MKKTLLLLAVCLFPLTASAQTLCDVNIKTLEGQTINFKDLGKSGKITAIIFWATWCTPCKKQLDDIKDYYDEWKEKYGMELVAISLDGPRSAAKVPFTVAEKGWDYRVLLDVNTKLQSCGNMASVYHIMLLDTNGKIVFQHIGVVDALELEEKIKAIALPPVEK